MCFANVEGGLEISLDKMKETDIVKILFAENPGIVIQISDKHKDEVKKSLKMQVSVSLNWVNRQTNAISW